MSESSGNSDIARRGTHRVLRGMPRSRTRQGGVALITVLLVFSIAAIVASKVVLTQSIDLQRTTQMINRTQAHYYALGAEQLAMLLLREDFDSDINKHGSHVDHLDEAWAQGPIILDIDNIGNVVANIDDLDGRFNLNNLQGGNTANESGKTDYAHRFQGILDSLGLDVDLANSLMDYIDIDNIESGVDTEGREYEVREIPYRAANQHLVDVSELRMIKGFTPEVVNQLRPHVNALRINGDTGSWALNINTASAVALTALRTSSEGTQATLGRPQSIGLTRAQDIADLQGYDYFVKILDLPNVEKTFEKHTASHGITDYEFLKTHSQFFEIKIRANYAGSVAYLTTIVYEEPGTEGPKYYVLERRENDNTLDLASAQKPPSAL